MGIKRVPPSMTHEELIAKLLDDPKVKACYEECAEEFDLLDQIMSVRRQAGLTQQQLAERMGSKQAALSRMESALASGGATPSFATLKKIARATGKKLQVRFV